MVSNAKKQKDTKQYKHRADHDRVEKVRKRERRSPSNDDESSSPPPPSQQQQQQTSSSNETGTGEGTERMSLSISETNKLRASLGLKPLVVDGNATAGTDSTVSKSSNSDENFVHRPAINLTEKKRSEHVTEKLAVHKEKRQLQEKYTSTPTLASQEADSASSWVEKMRQMDVEKRQAEKRAKLLQQMDEEFGVGDLVKDESEALFRDKHKKYTSKDLTGLRIEHSVETFREGQQIILTLKDKNILGDQKKEEGIVDDDDPEADVLINVNMADDEIAKKRADLAKKKTPGYRAYNDEDETADQFGMLQPTKILNQYDEKKKSSFRLESGGGYDLSDEKVMEDMRREFRARMESLAVPAPKLASEFYSPGEMEQFKKPKKVTKKKLRPRKMLKADDLLAMDVAAAASEQPHQSLVSLRPAEIRRPTAIVTTSKDRLNVATSLNKIKRTISKTTTIEDEDILGPENDLSSVAFEDDAFDELQSVINKTMKLKTKVNSTTTEKVLSELIEERDRRLKTEIKTEPMETGIILPLPPPTTVPDDKNLVLDTMSEFCRNVGGESLHDGSAKLALRPATQIKRLQVQSSKKTTTSSSSKNAMALDPDEELLQHALEQDDLDDDNDDDDDELMDDTPAEDRNTKPFRLDESILDSEPTLDRGLASALHLAKQKGYLEQEKTRQNAKFISDISAKHFTVEEKNYYDIDDKHSRRDRYTSGPLTDFKEKETYRPEVKLEYVDETGRRMNQKEAFRFLSHRFHGKGSGKKKTEKRSKKLVEEENMKKMSSVDTPLQTCSLLKQKQIQLKQPHIFLSGNRSLNDVQLSGSITKN